MRVLGGYLAAVAAAITVLMLAGASAALVDPSPPTVAEPVFPSDWGSVAITFVMATLFVTVFAMQASSCAWPSRSGWACATRPSTWPAVPPSVSSWGACCPSRSITWCKPRSPGRWAGRSTGSSPSEALPVNVE